MQAVVASGDRLHGAPANAAPRAEVTAMLHATRTAEPPDAPAPFYLETVTVEEENTYSR